MTRQFGPLVDAGREWWWGNRARRIHFTLCMGSSMAGTYKQHLVLFRPSNWGDIKIGDRVSFVLGNDFIYHRVVRTEDVGGEQRYFTKGDACSEEDLGHRTVDDIYAVCFFDSLEVVE